MQYAGVDDAGQRDFVDPNEIVVTARKQVEAEKLGLFGRIWKPLSFVDDGLRSLGSLFSGSGRNRLDTSGIALVIGRSRGGSDGASLSASRDGLTLRSSTIDASVTRGGLSLRVGSVSGTIDTSGLRLSSLGFDGSITNDGLSLRLGSVNGSLSSDALTINVGGANLLSMTADAISVGGIVQIAAGGGATNGLVYLRTDGLSRLGTGARVIAAERAVPQMTTNRIAGNAFRDEVADVLRASGADVTTEVYKSTPFGKRFIDIEVSRNGQVLGGIETKLGESRYTPAQRAKDYWLKINDGYQVDVLRRK